MLQVFEDQAVDLKHLESRPSQSDPQVFDFYVTLALSSSAVQPVVDAIKPHANVGLVFNHNPSLDHPCWFPRNAQDLDQFAHRVLEAGGELESDHPGFSDAAYRVRRNYLADVAIKYRHGTLVPMIDYTEEEVKTWLVVDSSNSLTVCKPCF